MILGDQLDLQGAALKNFDRDTDQIIMIESANEAQRSEEHTSELQSH